jgi:DNA-directed RNA polymerase subunit omega
MARVTIEDCLEKVENRFILIHMAAKRVRQFKKGAAPLVRSSNREVVTALREIAAGKLALAPKQSEKGRPADLKNEVEAKSLPVTTSDVGLQQKFLRVSDKSKEDQMAVGYHEAIVDGGAATEVSDESAF